MCITHSSLNFRCRQSNRHWPKYCLPRHPLLLRLPRPRFRRPSRHPLLRRPPLRFPSQLRLPYLNPWLLPLRHPRPLILLVTVTTNHPNHHRPQNPKPSSHLRLRLHLPSIPSMPATKIRPLQRRPHPQRNPNRFFRHHRHHHLPSIPSMPATTTRHHPCLRPRNPDPCCHHRHHHHPPSIPSKAVRPAMPWIPSRKVQAVMKTPRRFLLGTYSALPLHPLPRQTASIRSSHHPDNDDRKEPAFGTTSGI